MEQKVKGCGRTNTSLTLYHVPMEEFGQARPMACGFKHLLCGNEPTTLEKHTYGILLCEGCANRLGFPAYQTHSARRPYRAHQHGRMTQISVRQSGDVAILDLRGRWTIDGGEFLNRHLQKLVGDGVRKILLNLADITQIDSSGVSSIVRMRTSLRREGGDVRLLHPSKHAMDMLRILHLVDVIPTFDQEKLAVASFEPLPRDQVREWEA
jgi:anti-sigma B factor antagonist